MAEFFFEKIIKCLKINEYNRNSNTKKNTFTSSILPKETIRLVTTEAR